MAELQALAGVKVVDFSNHLAAPSVSAYLADYGAEVIKVERPGIGDELRYWGNNKNGVGLYFKVINRNKKSVTADLRTPLGVEIVKRLAKDADLAVENYRPGTTDRWGLGYEALSQINPGLVMLKVSGFGQTGPYADRPGFGTLAEAYSGYAYVTGYPDRPPLLPGFGLGDVSTGLMGAFLAMVAIFQRRQTGGPGQVIDLSLYETLYGLLGPQVINYDQLGIVQERLASRLPFVAPRNTYRTRDGRWVAIAGSNQSIFENICRALDAAELIEDARFRGNRERIENAPALDERLQAAVEKLDYAELARRFEAFEAGFAPIYSVADTFADPHFLARQALATVHDEELGGAVRMQNVAGRMSRTPGSVRSAGPKLGQHNREILIGRLGFTEAELKAADLPL